MAEQRYKAVQAVLAEGQTGHAGGQRLGSQPGNRSRRPAHCPHQMPAPVEVTVLRHQRRSGARRKLRGSEGPWKP